MFSLRTTFFALPALLLFGGCASECKSAADCSGALECSAGECVERAPPRTRPPGPTVDGGVVGPDAAPSSSDGGIVSGDSAVGTDAGGAGCIPSSGIVATSTVFSPQGTFPVISGDGLFAAYRSGITGTATDPREIVLVDLTTGASTIVESNGFAAERRGDELSISENGRYLAFRSHLDTLVPSDTNGESDVFVYDRVTTNITRVSVSSAGDEGDGQSASPAISSDGRYVAFVSAATNLVASDTNNVIDVFVHDRTTGQTELVSEGVMSSPGDAPSGAWAGVSSGPEITESPAISADGTLVAFTSNAQNLTADTQVGSTSDVYLRNRTAGTTSRITSGSLASGKMAISGDGGWIAYQVLERGFVRNLGSMLEAEELWFSRTVTSMPPTGPRLTKDGRYVVFLHDRPIQLCGEATAEEGGFRMDLVTREWTRLGVPDAEYFAMSNDGKTVLIQRSFNRLVRVTIP